MIADMTHSPFARLRPIPLTAITLNDTFWQPRQALIRTTTLPSQYQLCEETGRFDNLRYASGKKEGKFTGYFFNDSDIYKWLEAAAWVLATNNDPELAQLVENAIGEVEAAQESDGYLNSFFMGEMAPFRWSDLARMHELYCAGHLIQAAVAHYRATKQNQLLNIARRFADHIADTFGPHQRPGTPGHPEIEMALVELYRTTGEKRYLELSQFFLDQRGYGLNGGQTYQQDHRPFRQLEQLVGHAVRAVYLCSGAADLYAETGDESLREALVRLWQRMTERQMYISGGIGSRHEGESLGDDYELPNASAYTETCAAIGSFFWNWRMLQITGNGRYADLMEHTLYNAILPGWSLDGLHYFYTNPLANDGTHRRQPWFECACCPPNVARLIASLPGYSYSLSAEGVWVHLYGSHLLDINHEQLSVKLQQVANYPWDGQIQMTMMENCRFALFLRIPGWCPNPTLLINNELVAVDLVNGYAKAERFWQAGDVVKFNLPMPARFVESHPNVVENDGRIALLRGPLLYCLEQVDNPGLDLQSLELDSQQSPIESQLEHLPGIVGLKLTEGTAVPYFAWANRLPGPMQVWLKSSL